MKRILLLLLLCSTTLLMAQQTDPIQEAMASYDYETALSLIAQKKPATPLLLQKGKALRSLGLNAEALSTYQEIMNAIYDDQSQIRYYANGLFDYRQT